MTTNSRKLLQTQGLELAEEVAAVRLRRAGVKLGQDLGLPQPKPARRNRFPAKLVRRLAGC